MLKITVHPIRKETVVKPAPRTSNSEVVHDFVVVVANGHKAVDKSIKLLDKTQKAAALRAFRATHPLSEESKLLIPKLNKAGDLRGMVLSKRARCVHDITIKYAKMLEPLDRKMPVIGAFLEMAKSGPKYRGIFQSNAPRCQKILRLGLQVDLDVLRSITGEIPDISRVIAKALEWNVEIAGLAGVPGTDKGVQSIRKVNHFVQTEYEELTDPEGLMNFEGRAFNYIRTHIGLEPL